MSASNRAHKSPPAEARPEQAAGGFFARLSQDARARPEVLGFAAVLFLATVLRFWDLGSRALHHDESLHTTYAWYILGGRGYQHDPMMHGPFQYFLRALIYFFLGASDYTSRLPDALCGVLLVASPWLLRRWLGTGGSLAAAALLAISPVFLYFSRFARNDVYIALFTVLIAYCIFRY